MMLTDEEAGVLVKTRERYYTQDWRFGEMFDSNLVDNLSLLQMTFLDCVKLAEEDTETYKFIESTITDDNSTTAFGHSDIRH